MKSYKAWGTFFPLQNQIWNNPQEFFTKLTEISGIEYKSIREHFYHQKTLAENDYNTIQKTLFSVEKNNSRSDAYYATQNA